MARGGYRPGAGRKPGNKKGKTSIDPEEKKKLREMLSYDKKAKATFYREFLARVAKGDKLSLAEKKMMERLGAELSEDLNDQEKAEAQAENLDPLTYMLKVMNDPAAEKDRRDRMAIAAAPFVHNRKEGKGKKDDKEDRARAAGSGKFSPGQAPLKVVK